MILVDDIREYKTGPKHGPKEFRHWCHLASDDLSEEGLENLHRFAVSIGLRREWFQNHHNHPHYDLAPWGREAAIRAGAVPVSSRELVRRCSRSWQARRYQVEASSKASKIAPVPASPGPNDEERLD